MQAVCFYVAEENEWWQEEKHKYYDGNTHMKVDLYGHNIILEDVFMVC